MITRQIGWSNESNLLYQILKQITRLTSTLFSLKEATIPKYKVYTALLNQGVTPGDLSIIEMENTIGNIRLLYASDGTFLITSDNLFSSIDKCFVIMPSMMSSSALPGASNTFVGIRTTFQNSSAIQLETYAIENGVAKVDGFLNNAPIEVRIYN